SKQENFGLVVTEAMARGCPSVVSEHAYACEHVRTAEAGLVVPLEVSRVSHAIDDLLADPVKRQAMGQNGVQYSRANLSWDQIADCLCDLYSECLAESTRNAVN